MSSTTTTAITCESLGSRAESSDEQPLPPPRRGHRICPVPQARWKSREGDAIGESSNVTPAANVPAVGAGGVVVNAEAAPAPPPVSATPDPRVKKVIVAVHGVGDQYSFATLQSVVNQFCGFYGQPAAMPLGSFHTGQAAFSIHPPYPQDPFERLAFSDFYWAKIPRAVVDDKHTMEESKKWAGTIVERLRMRWKTTGSKGGCRDADFDLMKLVLGEMIQTLAVLERLCYIADRAGVFTFDLRKLLAATVNPIEAMRAD